MVNRVSYWAVLLFDNIFRIIPLRVLYIFSDCVYLLLFYIFGYRKKVVFTNLRNSFPEKSEKEIRKIAAGFYRHLCDLLIESIKGATMREKSIVSRMVIHAENLDQFYPSGRHVLAVGGHYGNWEWAGIAAGSQMKHKPVGFYKPLSNPYINEYIQHSRVKGRSVMASIAATYDAFKKEWGEPVVYYMIADQSPSSTRHAIWVKFLNQDTAALHGPEKYARLFNLPVIYTDTRRTGRGRYDVNFKVICENPNELPEGEITRRYMEMLETRIKADPRYYLWSHRRWKHHRS
jgi:Kdo2-lipid IVA lauroyltransferase/acyltransferase